MLTSVQGVEISRDNLYNYIGGLPQADGLGADVYGILSALLQTCSPLTMTQTASVPALLSHGTNCIKVNQEWSKFILHGLQKNHVGQTDCLFKGVGELPVFAQVHTARRASFPGVRR